MADYYPFGWLMSDRKQLQYRYGYQGQELDSVTNWHAFQLRMYDGRIGRWMSVDPYGEFHSPYLAMGNNPVTTIDPTGGKTGGGGPPNINEIAQVINNLHLLQLYTVEGITVYPNWIDRQVIAVSSWYNDVTAYKNWSKREDYSFGTLNKNIGSGGKLSVGFIAGRHPATSAAWMAVNGTDPIDQLQANLAYMRGMVGGFFSGGSGNTTSGGSVWSGASGQRDRYLAGNREASRLYPNKAGKIEHHHIRPQYLGGKKNSPTAPLDAAYHQVITNEFRANFGYGQGGRGLDIDRVRAILKEVYDKYPLPPGY